MTAARASALAATLVAALDTGAARRANAQFVTLRPDTAGQGVLAAAAATPRRLVLRDAGPGAPGTVLRDVLARPHLLVIAADTGLTLGRATRADQTLVVVGGPVRLAGTVRGDVVVLGDLFLRPGADIAGRAIAIGGGVYHSTLARVGGDLLSYRDVAGTAGAAADDGAGGLALDLRSVGPTAVPRLSLPGTFGLRIPAYTRVDGLAVTFGPEVAFDTGRVRLEPTVTYRSHLGVIDAGVRAAAELPRRLTAELRAGRGTFTNDAWSRVDLINSIVFAGTGQDARNYYRADRLALTVGRRSDVAAGVIEPVVGVLTERSWSLARDSAAARPFTLFGRDDAREGARRPNPAVTGGRITSALAGLRVRRDTPAGTHGRAEVQVEQALAVARGGRFTRVVIDLALERPLPNDRSATLLAHGAVAAGRGVPSQRYAYLGGGPTLPSLFLLSQGGTELVWAEARYTLPLRVVRVPVVGSYPAFTLRGAAGAAGVNTLPALTPNVGLRLSVGPLRADYVFDPRGRGRRRLSVGVGLR